MPMTSAICEDKTTVGVRAALHQGVELNRMPQVSIDAGAERALLGLDR